jgi:hypothetical protein
MIAVVSKPDDPFQILNLSIRLDCYALFCIHASLSISTAYGAWLRRSVLPIVDQVVALLEKFIKVGVS